MRGDDLKSFAELKKLESLEIGCNSVTNDGFRHLESVTSLKGLSIFDCNKVDDGVFEHLAKIKTMTGLNLDYAKITDAGLEKVKMLPKIEALYLSHTNVTAVGVKKLRAALPKLRVSWDGDPKEKGK